MVLPTRFLSASQEPQCRRTDGDCGVACLLTRDSLRAGAQRSGHSWVLSQNLGLRPPFLTFLIEKNLSIIQTRFLKELKLSFVTIPHKPSRPQVFIPHKARHQRSGLLIEPDISVQVSIPHWLDLLPFPSQAIFYSQHLGQHSQQQ